MITININDCEVVILKFLTNSSLGEYGGMNIESLRSFLSAAHHSFLLEKTNPLSSGY